MRGVGVVGVVGVYWGEGRRGEGEEGGGWRVGWAFGSCKIAGLQLPGYMHNVTMCIFLIDVFLYKFGIEKIREVKTSKTHVHT